jgi:hypothetical protein
MTKPEEYVKSGEVVRAEDKEIDSMPEDERETERIQKIRSMYDSGIPFFRKENIKNIHQQLLRVKEKGERIWVVGLDGVKVDFETQTGSINPGLEPENEFVLYVCLFAVSKIKLLTKFKDGAIHCLQVLSGACFEKAPLWRLRLLYHANFPPHERTKYSNERGDSRFHPPSSPLGRSRRVLRDKSASMGDQSAMQAAEINSCVSEYSG